MRSKTGRQPYQSAVYHKHRNTNRWISLGDEDIKRMMRSKLQRRGTKHWLELLPETYKNVNIQLRRC